jgi:hypothetical protein
MSAEEFKEAVRQILANYCEGMLTERDVVQQIAELLMQ